MVAVLRILKSSNSFVYHIAEHIGSKICSSWEKELSVWKKANSFTFLKVKMVGVCGVYLLRNVRSSKAGGNLPPCLRFSNGGGWVKYSEVFSLVKDNFAPKLPRPFSVLASVFVPYLDAGIIKGNNKSCFLEKSFIQNWLKN